MLFSFSVNPNPELIIKREMSAIKNLPTGVTYASNREYISSILSLNSEIASILSPDCTKNY